jgi:DNA polymerase
MTAAEDRDRPGARRWVPAGASVRKLRHAAVACRGCELWRPATQVVFSSGSEHARVMLVGEQPRGPSSVREEGYAALVADLRAAAAALSH